MDPRAAPLVGFDQGVQIAASVFIHIDPWPSHLRTANIVSETNSLFHITVVVANNAFHSVTGVSELAMRFIFQDWLEQVQLGREGPGLSIPTC